MELEEVTGSSPRDPDPIPPLGEVLDFMRLIWALHHALQATSKNMEASLGFTGPQRLVLRIVGRFPGISAGSLASILHLHPSTLTGILDRLSRRGLLSRRPDPRDRRRALLGLTAKGRRFEVSTEGTVEAGVRRVLSQVPPGKMA
ncbi:MAG: MarR family winged helix-turn-helix transcriptional regulator, partial [Myxococcaceae bacterium]